MNMADMVNAVKKHATSNYDNDGWDYVVEAFEDNEISDLIRKEGCRTKEEAIAAVGETCNLLNNVRKDVQAEIF